MIRHIVTFILYQIEQHPQAAKGLLWGLIAFLVFLALIDKFWLQRG